MTVGCVSFLNALPLIDGLSGVGEGGGAGPRVVADVPSRLLEGLEGGRFDVALCPVIDYQRASTPLSIVPAGGIGCDGPTLTVRLFSRVPWGRVDVLHADADSHTSVALARVVFRERFGRTPEVVDFNARRRGGGGGWPETVLLIGDKVVTGGPPADDYPYQLDLGEAWRALSGGPFVFAVWMARRGAALGELPAILQRRREVNAGRIDAIVRSHAAAHGWPAALARRYLGSMLRYGVGARELAAIEDFWARAAAAGALGGELRGEAGGEGGGIGATGAVRSMDLAGPRSTASAG